MAQVIALYMKPADPAAFDACYHATHLPPANFAQVGVELPMFDTRAV